MKATKLQQRGPGAKNPRKGSQKNSKARQTDSVPLVSGPNEFMSLSRVFPPRMNMKLKFWTQVPFNLVASTFANYRFRPSGAFDIDPALGGTSMAGFAECAAFYATYRVCSSKIKVTLINPSNVTPVTLIVLPMNADPTNSFSNANIIASMGNPYSISKTSGLLGSPPVVLSRSMTTKKIFGDSMVLFDHNFTSLVTTVPANNWFWNVCVFTSLSFISTAVYATVEIEVDCEFYDRTFLPA